MANARPITQELLQQTWPATELGKYLGAAYDSFATLLHGHLGDLTLIEHDGSFADLVADDSHMSTMFLVVHGKVRLEPGARNCAPKGRPAGMILHPGDLCGEYEAGIAGTKPIPFRWSIVPMDADSAILKIAPTLTKLLFAEQEIVTAIRCRNMAITNPLRYRELLPRMQRNLSKAAEVLADVAPPDAAQRGGAVKARLSKNFMAATLGLDKRTLDQVLKYLQKRELVLVRSERGYGTTFTIMSMPALQHVKETGCDRRQVCMVPMDRYKRRADEARPVS